MAGKKKKKKKNEANWMVSNSAKLDRRTKQHTQFGVSASNGSRNMTRTKVAENKRKKKNECRQSHKASPTGIAKYTYISIHGLEWQMEVIERALMDYVLITKRMIGRLKDVHVFRDVAVGMSD